MFIIKHYTHMCNTLKGSGGIDMWTLMAYGLGAKVDCSCDVKSLRRRPSGLSFCRNYNMACDLSSEAVVLSGYFFGFQGFESGYIVNFAS